MSDQRKIIIVGQQDGDVGKSTTAIYLAEMHRAAGRNFVVLDADDKHKKASGESSLAHALPNHTVIWLGTGPSLAEMEADPDSTNLHWDKVRTVLDEHDVILDLGANTVQRLLEYAMRMHVAEIWAHDGIEVEFWVPFLSDQGSIETGLEALSMAGKAFGKAALRAVRNHRKGGEFHWTGTPIGNALAAMEKAGVVFVDLPKASIPQVGLTAMDSGPWSAFQVRDMGLAGVTAGLGIDPKQRSVAQRTFFACEDWIKSVTLGWAGLVPGGNG
ncbi:MAG TPA: hypothetical protein VK558_02395 [Patescibacteria group bacterium]|nr:hypothetical protein [Patescibacteria group bacterium]